MSPEPTSNTLELCTVTAKGSCGALLSRNSAMAPNDIEKLQVGLKR